MLSHLRQSLVAWILIGYAALWSLSLAFTCLPGGEAFRERRGFALQHVLRTSKPLLQPDRTRDLARYLNDAQATGFVDWFELDEKGKTESAGQAPSARPVLAEPVSDIDGWVWGRAEGRDVSLRIGSGYGWRTRLHRGFAEEQSRLPFELVFLAFACAIGVYFQRKARRQAARGAVEGAPRKETKRLKARGETARPKTTGEIGEFDGVCGRSTLLNQAELARTLEPEKFFASLEEFYADCAAVLGRYKGRLNGVHGHEIVFYFSEKDPAMDARLALAAARDLDEAAARRGFRLGTALAQGRLHGAQLLSGFALFGEPVEETSDLVQAMVAQKENALWVTDSLATHAEPHATFRPAQKRLHARVYVGGPEVRSVIERAREKGAFAELAFHRGDAALAQILHALADGPSWDRDHYVGVVSELRRVPCRRCGPAVVDAYRALLGAELARKDTYRLSSVVALASALLGRALVDRTLEKLFLQAVAVKDRRVRANAVELFTRFFPDREIPELRPLIRDEDNRVSANALIKAACERFDEKVIARIDERVRCGSVAHVASALHAMGEIAVYYRKHDPLFLGTKHSFLRLFDGIPALVGHPNTMIRRQALIAAHKLQSEALDARLRELFSLCTDAELLGLFSTVYGWRKDAVQKAA